ncbi:MAG: 3-dehydroquinate synthase [Anaerolineae bacterium]|nr:3-dehydroquinate synthase [Anaerolineae bacterium]
MASTTANIVLTGFMGTGKSSVGREVARQLGRPFVDMDAEIEARAGMAISEIFRQGEDAFRALEREVCRALSERRGLVIATGGGALIDPQNRRRMMASGPVFCLHCTVDRILERLAQAQDRPLLDVDDRRREIERLLEARAEAYAAIPRQIDTTALTVDQVAARVIEDADAILLPVRTPSGGYPIHIGRGLLERTGALVRTAIPAQRVALVTNPVVGPLYGARVCGALRDAGIEPVMCTMPDGEANKTLGTLASLYTQFVACGLDRSGAVLALGGGVTCDVAGFAAATYMRGVPVVQVPTTLLAMVDASVGGKTAVDLPEGKNLVGAFVQPALVVIDPDVLGTLPAGDVASGMAELLKHGVLADPELFAALERAAPDPGDWERWIARSLQVKIDVVERDPFERGWRAVLNLGHTTAHALEQLSGFSLRHGEAVSIGMVVAAQIAVARGTADPPLPARIAAALARHGLPVRCPPYDAQQIWIAMGRDKKRRAGRLRWILPRAVGAVEIVEDVPREVVIDALCALGAAC